MKQILKGWALLSLFKLGLIKDDEIEERYHHRKKQCENCPLNKNNWCSKHKITIKDNELISGCGCYNPASWFVKDKKCNLNKWKI